MWILLGLAAVYLAFIFWPFYETNEQTAQRASDPVVTPTFPPTLNPLRITYRITRRDLFTANLTLWLRNRLLKISIPIFVGFELWRGLGSSLGEVPIAYLALQGLEILMVNGAILVSAFLFVGLVIAFTLKHQGVLCEHVLEITDEGLVESTEMNKTLHRWLSVSRITRMFGYLFVYVGEMNSHQVPLRCVNPEQLAAFEKELRLRAAAAHHTKK